MSMPQDLEEGNRKGIFYSRLVLSSLILSLCVVAGHSDQPKSGAHFQDGSRQLFSIYMEIGEKQDEKTAERWKADADVILIFVSLCVAIHDNKQSTIIS